MSYSISRDELGMYYVIMIYQGFKPDFCLGGGGGGGGDDMSVLQQSYLGRSGGLHPQEILTFKISETFRPILFSTFWGGGDPMASPLPK